jgi:PAS domain S-box-containing protein
MWGIIGAIVLCLFLLLVLGVQLFPQHHTLVFSMISLAVGAAVCLFIDGVILRRLLTLERELQQLTVRGNLTARLPVPSSLAGRDELDRLPLAINEMLCALARTQRDAGEAIRFSERRYRTLAHLLPVGIFRADADGGYVYTNERWSEIAGLSRLEALGDGWAQAIDPEDRDRVVAAWRDTVDHGSTFKAEYRFLNAEGRVNCVIGMATAEKDRFGDILGFVGTITDISDRVEVEEALRESEERFRTIVETFPGVIWIAQADTTVSPLYLSDRVEEIFGYPKHAFLAGQISFADLLGPAQRTALQDAIAAALTTQEPFALELCFRRRDGSTVWILETGTVVPHTHGQHHLLGSMIDITERKEATERERLLHRLQEEERLRSEFLSAVSHELKTPLTPIIGGAELLESGVLGAVNERQLTTVTMVNRQAQRLLRLIDDLLDLFRVESGNMRLRCEPVDLCQSVQESMAAYAVSFREQGLSLTYAGASLPPVFADPQRLGQILDNLLSNALKFTEVGGVTLHTALEDGMARLEVCDTGIGIAPEHKDGIFQRFYQVDAHRKGAGLGLPIVTHLVNAHGGDIRVESTPGQGSTFVVRLPLVASADDTSTV